MAFRFSLETVLQHRKRLEEAAQREYAEAQAAVEACLKRIEDMYRRLDEVRDEVLSVQRGGARGQVEEIREMEQFLGGHKLRIESVRQEARHLLSVAETKQEALILAAQEKKTLVKLKERRKAEYDEWLKRAEAKELDDITMVREARGRR